MMNYIMLQWGEKTGYRLYVHSSKKDKYRFESQFYYDSTVPQLLFDDVRWSWIWLIVRLYVGYEGVVAVWSKINNSILLILAIFLVLAWKTAGWRGLDRRVMVDLGTQRSPGLAFQEKTEEREKLHWADR